MSTTGIAALTIAELREFAGFTSAEQRYIKRSLDIGLARGDAVQLWARDASERASIQNQYAVYKQLNGLRDTYLDESSLDGLAMLMGPLLRVAAFDLAQERIQSFSAFRFLYERLLGPEFRPWLPAAFCGAAALPQIRPDRRKLLLQSLSEAAATAPAWSDSRPVFYPEFVEREVA